MSQRTLIVGDVHGCANELQGLLEHARFRPDSDRLILVGDLVAKGPRSRAVVELARSLGALTVRGNHDEHVLRWRRAVQTGAPRPELKRDHRAVCDDLDEPDWAYLEGAPLWRRVRGLGPDGGDVLVVHAGFDPQVVLEGQDPANLMNMRSIRTNGSVSKRADDGVPWASVWPGPELVVFGHDAIRKLQRHPHAFGLDTGCVYGGELTALALEPHAAPRLHSVRAERVWCVPGGAP
ncbi:MAG: metallophosphoesterase [Myxococcales bacterium]|nr:metallophosphoesterase [Myxococcales bacterium]